MSIRAKLVDTLGSVWFVLLISIALWIAAGYAPRGVLQMWSFVVINILLAQSINLLSGITGQISLGHAGYFAIGAYSSGLLVKMAALPFPLAVTLATLIALVIGLLVSIPSGRVREFYLAMMSLAFGLLVYEVVREWQSMTGGVMGLRGVPSAQIGTLEIMGIKWTAAYYFRLLLVIALITLYLLRNFVKSHFGRAFFAVHTSEIAAESLGVSQANAKHKAYAISAGMAGLAGALYAHLVGYLTPESFNLMRSIEILVMSIVGGFGSLVGQVFGAVVFTYLPQQLQAFSKYQYIVYGFILMFVFLVMPKGIAGLIGTRTRYSHYKDHIKSKSAIDKSNSADSFFEIDQSRFDKDKPLLSINNVEKEFFGLKALNGVSLGINMGHVTALVGPNGSGKTTLVNLISGVLPVTRGSISFAGTDITHWPAYKVARLGITRTFQDPRNVGSFTVRENVITGANRLYKSGLLACSFGTKGSRTEERNFAERVDMLLKEAGLEDYADKEVGGLPYGIQRLTEVVRALASNPVLLMLDEPAAGLTEVESELLVHLIRLAKKNGIAVLIIDHHMEFLSSIVDEVIVLDSGSEIYRGDMAGLMNDEKVIEAYLGQEEENA